MNVGVHIPRRRYVVEVANGRNAIPNARRFISEVLDDLEPDRMFTLYGSGDMDAVEIALEKDIDITAILAWKGQSPGKSNLVQYNKLWNKCDHIFMNEDIGFGGGHRFYEQAQVQMIDMVDALIIVWDGEYWNSAKTLCHMAMAYDLPVALYLIRYDKYVVLYNHKEVTYTKEEMLKCLK